MTIRVTIKNDNDNGDDRVVRVRPNNITPSGERTPVYGPNVTQPEVQNGAHVLKPGEEHDFWLHSGMMIEVFEG